MSEVSRSLFGQPDRAKSLTSLNCNAGARGHGGTGARAQNYSTYIGEKQTENKMISPMHHPSHHQLHRD